MEGDGSTYMIVCCNGYPRLLLVHRLLLVAAAPDGWTLLGHLVELAQLSERVVDIRSKAQCFALFETSRFVCDCKWTVSVGRLKMRVNKDTKASALEPWWLSI